MGVGVLGIADLGRNRLGLALYGRYGGCQLRTNHFRNDKNSGGLFQFFIRQRNKYRQTFFYQMGGFHHQKRHRISIDNRRYHNAFYARTRSSDDSVGFGDDGYSGQTTARSEADKPPDGFVGSQ